MVFHLTTAIAAPPAVVFDFVSDLFTMPQWYSAVESVHLVEGSSRRDARYAVHRRLPTGRARNEVRVTSYIPDTEVTFSSVSGPTPFTYCYRVSPAPPGALLQLDGSITAAGLPGPAALLSPLAEQVFGRGMRENLLQLKTIIENNTRFADLRGSSTPPPLGDEQNR
ncbi:SRPBCC family protein [Spirillospora sp. NPDC047418]